ncbi:uncharacterized protein LOC141590365 [Silene latifolia]|uniref:uncharacterized protein LOC141590365 n=1 Tax=Silene latifolia TaxID=37657 RepID=UPI003D77DD3F
MTAPVTDEEIKQAMFSIDSNKSPGPDGYGSQFFKDAWTVVGKDVCLAVRDAFVTGNVLKASNNTIITLVPKVDVPETVLQFRPIACCNTVYKCLAKVICNRLNRILPDIISPTQSAFIPGRDIVGNILICQDLIKLYKRRTCLPRLMMKIDLHKAYDSIEWSFLKDMLAALGFPQQSISLIMECVSSPSYSLALNGEIFGFFKGKRWLRQGDPLSPILFTICLEYLSRLLDNLKKFRGFRYHPLCARVGLTHLCFADDLLLFCRGDLRSFSLLLRAFGKFSAASGLRMSNGKSNLYCNGDPESLVKNIEESFGIKRGALPFKYPGVSIVPKRLGVLDCQCLVDRVIERIMSLAARKLSYAGRAILIKSVLSTLHSYWARIFILPKTVLNKIEAACRSFLWHDSDNSESPALVSWKQVCKDQKYGGLGFKNPHRWNVASLAKYVWWIDQKADHLWVRWVHAIYIKQNRWDDYEPTLGASWAWKRICWVKNQVKPLILNDQCCQSGQDYAIQTGYTWLMGNEEVVPWHPWLKNKIILPKHGFFIWLIAHKRLLTQDRLLKMEIIQVNCCRLCGNAAEHLNHLFFLCPYSQECLKLVAEWLKIRLPSQEVISWWLRFKSRSLVKKQVIAACLANLIYEIWLVRNKCRLENVVPRPVVVAKMIRASIWECSGPTGSIAETLENLFGSGPVNTPASAPAVVVEDAFKEEGPTEEAVKAKGSVEVREGPVIGAAGAGGAVGAREEPVVEAARVKRAQPGSKAGTSGRRVARRRAPRPTRRELRNVARVVERPHIRHVESRGQKRRRAETVEDDAHVAGWEARRGGRCADENPGPSFHGRDHLSGARGKELQLHLPTPAVAEVSTASHRALWQMANRCRALAGDLAARESRLVQSIDPAT